MRDDDLDEAPPPWWVWLAVGGMFLVVLLFYGWAGLPGPR